MTTIEPNAKSAIITTLHQGDRAFVNEGRVRNNRPPSPVDWQKVTSMKGYTGWINANYIAPEGKNYSRVQIPLTPFPLGFDAAPKFFF
jgi:Bacterial SH3 domain